tara:strand:- start:70 stop:573 length:504 start_codon:yes stop_codon:yes gene_type:complete
MSLKMKIGIIKKNIYWLLLSLIIFFLDRFFKIYVINLFDTKNISEIYITPFLNLFLIWNKGIAFGLFSFNDQMIYKIITILIVMVVLIIFMMILNSEGVKKYSLASILGGSLGNLYDRLYFSAVPDFFDFHFVGFHWFIFNIADIFITVGVIIMICNEIFKKKLNEN